MPERTVPMTTFAKTAILCAALVASAILGLSRLEFGASEAIAAENSALYCQGYAQEAQRRYRDYRRKQCGNLVNIVEPGLRRALQLLPAQLQVTTDWLKDQRYRYLLNGCKS